MRRLPIVTVIAVTAGLLAGCGGDDAAEPGATAPVEQPGTAGAPAVSDPVDETAEPADETAEGEAEDGEIDAAGDEAVEVDGDEDGAGEADGDDGGADGDEVLVEVPGVVGQTDAGDNPWNELRDLGLEPVTVLEDPPEPVEVCEDMLAPTVWQQAPAAGSFVAPGTEVMLYLCS